MKQLAILLLLFALESNAKVIKVDTIRTFNFQKSDYIPIPKIELTEYKSVQTRKNQDSSLALGISLSGGGSRAQYFSTGVLIGLDDIKTIQQF